MGKTVDITNQRFGRLIAITKIASGQNSKWLCQCDCGNTKIVYLGNLKYKRTQSCGCIVRAHGFSDNPMFPIWRNMKNRCYDKNDEAYNRYGGRGIKICDQWLNSFEAFLVDMGKRPSKSHSVERKNNDGNYEPSNCKWATYKEQARNTRANRMVTFNNETKCISEWAEILNIPRRTLHNRLFRLNWSIDRALTTSRIR